jgi:two-component system sensor histidine kinase PilS (NtrC family)
MRYLNFYRVILAAFFVIPVVIGQRWPVLGSHDMHIYSLVSLSYLMAGIFASFAIHWRKPSYIALVYGLTTLDICALTLLMHTSGGVESGLGLLIVVAIAGSSLLMAGRTAGFFAASAAVAILVEQTYAYFEGASGTNYTHAGILGVTLFGSALLSHALSARLRETEALAAQRGIDLANLTQLNEHVIKRMQSGIIVVDAHNYIRLINESAWNMLGQPGMRRSGNKTLNAISPQLADQLEKWKQSAITESKILRHPNASVDILPSFTKLGRDRYSGTLIFLEDSARMAQQAQQMKLASLGRLTAGIAHEIRNPLGAISHAEQLLSESDHLDPADRRLTEIIHSHTQRVNAIIENVMQLSRRGAAKTTTIELTPWLQSFAQEFALSQDVPEQDIAVNIAPGNVQIDVDATQLHQVLWNLCHNGLRYSRDYPNSPKLELVGDVSPDSGRFFLDVIDHGPGIDPDSAQNIFEPFFTTDAKGSGLGLYIAKELCANNNAQLSYIPVANGGSCFRIEFSQAQLIAA